ncbi:esterase [Brenneria sp. g21c3]|uniref:esterase n=1 Tax=Brenneria sp. g21c3 TaxID=3093893 RepID=UPI002EA87790|nr:esterase [Brenneria sp. g21c3]
MVEISLDSINGIDVLHAVPGGKKDLPLPTIFFFHGYLSSKEVYSYFGYALAAAGFRVILPDAAMHGARFDGNEARRLRHFWDILQSNIQELPDYVDAYRQRGLLADRRIGVCGASLGGMSALGAMARYPWISAVAAFMGSGYFSTLSRSLYPPVPAGSAEAESVLRSLSATLAEYDVSSRLENLADRPLLLWHGEADDVVPAEESARLYQALQANHPGGNLTYLTEAGVTHRITPTALRAGGDFFRRYLSLSETGRE